MYKWIGICSGEIIGINIPPTEDCSRDYMPGRHKTGRRMAYIQLPAWTGRSLFIL